MRGDLCLPPEGILWVPVLIPFRSQFCLGGSLSIVNVASQFIQRFMSSQAIVHKISEVDAFCRKDYFQLFLEKCKID